MQVPGPSHGYDCCNWQQAYSINDDSTKYKQGKDNPIVLRDPIIAIDIEKGKSAMLVTMVL